MNELSMAVSPGLTMSSREIAELVCSRHDAVKRSIERCAERGAIDIPQLVGYLDSVGRSGQQEYLLDKRSSLIVVAQLCPEFTARIVDRWQELEAKLAQPALNPANLSRLQLIEIAMQAEQERMVLEQKVDEMTPIVHAHNRIATASEGAMCVTDAAKVLQLKPKQLFAWLSEHQWIYRRTGSITWIAYQNRIQSMLLEHKVTRIVRDDGSEKLIEQVLVTAKGLARLSEEMSLPIAH